MRKIILGCLIFLSNWALATQLNGTYTIGPSGTYTTISAAVTQLNLIGISGDVVFEIDPTATYNEQFAITNFANSNNKQVRFKSNNILIPFQLSYTATSAPTNFVIKISGPHNIIFENFKFSSLSTSYHTIILFEKSGNNIPYNITFIGGEFHAQNPGISTGEAMITNFLNGIGNNEVRNIHIENNKFIGGYTAIDIGQVSTQSGQLYINNNDFQQQNSSAIALGKTRGSYIFHNTFSNPYNMSGTKSIQAYNIDSLLHISQNSCLNYPIDISTSSTNTGEDFIKIDNNYITSSALSPVKLNSMSGNGKIQVIHNTITGSSNYLMEINQTVKFLIVKNNLFQQYNSVGQIFFHSYAIISGDHDIDHNAYLYPNGFATVISTSKTFGLWNTDNDFDGASVNDQGISWNPSWGAIDNIKCGAPSRYKAAIFMDTAFEHDIHMNKRIFYPTFVGASELTYSIGTVGDISGNAISGSTIINAGKVILYSDITNQLMLDSIGETTLGVNGDFLFSNLTPRNYTLKFFPDANTFPDRIPTYYGGNFHWTNIIPVSADTCNNGTALTVNIDSLESIGAGSGKISGYITRDHFTNKTSDPIPGIDVVLDKIPPSKSINIAVTDSNGYYEFDNLPYGNYQIKIDFAGLQNDSLITVTIDNNNANYSAMDYCVDTAKTTQVCGFSAGIGDIKKEENKSLTIVPNPFQNELTIYVNSNLSLNRNISVSEISGRIIHQERSAENNIKLDLSDFESGVYIIQIQSNEAMESYKVIKD